MAAVTYNLAFVIGSWAGSEILVTYSCWQFWELGEETSLSRPHHLKSSFYYFALTLKMSEAMGHGSAFTDSHCPNRDFVDFLEYTFLHLL